MNIIFDIGQVLMGWRPKLDIYFPAPIAHEVEHAIWGTGYFEELDLGIVPEEEVLQKMIASAPHLEQQIIYTWNHLDGLCERFDYAVPWIKDLKAKGHSVYFISNYSKHLRESVPQVLDFLPYADGGIFSCDVNVMKPDRKIYEMLCERYHLKPEECVFIDDRPENVAAAKEVGMAAVVFDGAWCARMKRKYAEHK